MGKNRGSPLPTMGEDITGTTFDAEEVNRNGNGVFTSMEEMSESELDDLTFDSSISHTRLEEISNSEDYSEEDRNTADFLIGRRRSILGEYRKSSGAELMDDEVMSLLQAGTHTTLMNRQLVDLYRNVVNGQSDALSEGIIHIGDGFDRRFEEIKSYLEPELDRRGMSHVHE